MIDPQWTHPIFGVINNLDAMAQLITEIKKFADEMKLGQVITSPTNS
jgi:hypothetical protein